MDFKLLAAQLRKPEGEFGKVVAGNMNNSNNAINLHTIELLQIADHDTVLEIGMGNGFFCGNIVADRDSVTYTGCDFSELMIAEAESLNKDIIEAGQAHFVLGSAEALPFGNNSFSKIFTVNTIYFWEEPLRPLAEIKRVLKPEGVVVISLRTGKSMAQMPFVQYGFTLYEESGLLSLLTTTGFSSITITTQPDPLIYIGEQAVQMDSLYAVCRK